MNVNIYYGGRGLVDDPTITVLNKITDVLNELRVNVEKYNLFEMKNAITTLPQTLKEADAVILASTVEWFGIGGYMLQFLDACWLYADKSMLEKLYMFPIVMSRASGEKEAAMSLSNAWEMLGGKSCNGLAAYVADPVEFELNAEYQAIFEKKAEEIYRTVSQKVKTLPSSNNAIKSNIVSDRMRLTPQESEQLSKYASDDTYIKKQKEDIEELSSMFRNLWRMRIKEVSTDIPDYLPTILYLRVILRRAMLSISMTRKRLWLLILTMEILIVILDRRMMQRCYAVWITLCLRK